MNILNKLTIKHLKENKKRTIVTIVGIVLSTALMVGIGLLFSTIRDNSIKLIEENNGTHHVGIGLEKTKLNVIANNNNVKEYKYYSLAGYSAYPNIQNEYKPYLQVISANQKYLEELKLLEGRLPQGNTEIVISNHLLEDEKINLKVGDVITIEVGQRVDLEGNPLNQIPYTNELIYETNEDGNKESVDKIVNEKLVNLTAKQYTIVGICERDILEDYQNPGYSVFTTNEDSSKIMAFVTYKKINKTYELTENIAKNLGYKPQNEESDVKFYQEISYNSDLLSMYGVTSYDNLITAMSSVICIILGLISIACIIVIYNSFAISVMERKKQFGLFSSIGATKHQLKHTVFYEALLVGIIGIPIGILSAYLGIGIVISIINHLLPEVFSVSLSLTTYPLFVIIPVIFMIITIWVSAYLPSKKASKVSPIESIRQNDDIKITSKKVKTPKYITKLFGIEGELAHKNMKRNKRKYRITIVSLFISIVLFISFSSFVIYGLESAYDYTEMPEFEYSTSIYCQDCPEEQTDEIASDIIKTEGIKKYTIVQGVNLQANASNIIYHDSFINSSFYSNQTPNYIISLINLDDASYNEYKKQVGLKTDQPILINSYSAIDYSNGSRKALKVDIFAKIEGLEITSKEDKGQSIPINDLYFTDKMPMGVYVFSPEVITIVVNDETYNSIVEQLNLNNNTKNIYLISDNYDLIDKKIEQYNKAPVQMNGYNIKEDMKLLSNMILVVKILLYGFISLVTLIGVTSVLNTINTSIALRRVEFSVLRSIGLTPKGFNKMLFFESILFGLKSLFYGIPVGVGITLLLHGSFSNIVSFNELLIPWKSIIIAIFAVFIIVAICMWYSSHKIKKENILDAIRNENI